MRKLLAIATLCIFSLLLKNEPAISKSNCQVSCKTIPKKTVEHSRSKDTHAEAANGLKPYDGFFFKI